MTEPTHISSAINSFVGGLGCEHTDPDSPDDKCGFMPCPNFSTDANIWWN